MQTFLKKLTAAVALLVIAAGFVWMDFRADGAEAAGEYGGYYDLITATEGDELLGQVHDLITKTHTKYSSYDDCKSPSIVKRTDPGPNGQLTEFYAQAELSSTWQSGAAGTWNREHVWCQSLSNGLWGESGGGGDLLHIRPTESRVNSARNNDKFGYVKNGNSVIYRDKNNKEIAVAGRNSGGVFEPNDSVKGDVARIVMYMYTHYNTYSNVHGTTNGNGRSNYFGTLRYTNIMSASSESAALRILLDWNELDPPAQIEMDRNEAAQQIQGNRNPFVDHPEYAPAIWGDDADDEPQGGGTNVEKYRAAVNEIKADGTLGQRLTVINNAISAYNKLTATEKATVSEVTQKLQNAIDEYNAQIEEYNACAQANENAALGGACVLFGPSGKTEEDE